MKIQEAPAEDETPVKVVRITPVENEPLDTPAEVKIIVEDKEDVRKLILRVMATTYKATSS